VPDAVITVICAPDGGWSYHPKHVELDTLHCLSLFKEAVFGTECHPLLRRVTSFTEFILGYVVNDVAGLVWRLRRVMIVAAPNNLCIALKAPVTY
jgi:hypothetical protein